MPHKSQPKIAEFIFLIGSRGLVALSALLATRCYATILPLSEIGNLVYFLSLIQLFTMFGVYPAGTNFQNNFLQSVKDYSATQKTKDYIKVLCITGFLAGGVVCVAKTAGILKIDWPFLALFSVTFLSQVASPLRETILGCFNLLLERRLFIVLSLFSSYITLGISVGVTMAFKTSLAWCASTMVGQLLFGFIFLWILIRNLNQLSSYKSCKASIRPNAFFTLVVVAFGTWILTDLGKIGIDYLGGNNGKNQLGLYSIVMSVGGAFIILADRVFADLFAPKLFNVAVFSRKDLPNFIGKYLKRFAAMLFFVQVIVFAFNDVVLWLIVGDRYRDVANWIFLGALFRSGICFVSACQLVAQAADRPGILIAVFFRSGFFSAASICMGFFVGAVVGALIGGCIGVTFATFDALTTLRSSKCLSFHEEDSCGVLTPTSITALILFAGFIRYSTGSMLFALVGLLLIGLMVFRRKLQQYAIQIREWFLAIHV